MDNVFYEKYVEEHYHILLAVIVCFNPKTTTIFEPLCCWWLILPIQNDAEKLEND